MYCNPSYIFDVAFILANRTILRTYLECSFHNVALDFAKPSLRQL